MAQVNTVIFVDDEPNVLSGIKRMLRSMRNDFSLHFAASADEALATMAEEAMDIVVSDMRMPGKSGSEFLAIVQEKYPRTIRIMLSGQADDESIMNTVSVVHQFLAKPCEPERLKDVLVRAAALFNLMSDNRLRAVVSGLGSLPSLPEIYVQLQRALNNPEVVLDDVAAIIEQDLAMTAKVLQLVNSSFFGLYQQVKTVDRAVKLLGLDTVRTLVLGAKVFSEFTISSQLLSLDKLYYHSMAVANCSKRLAMTVTDDPEMLNTCMLAGVLHDIGKLILLSQLTEEYEHILTTAEKEQVPPQESEKTILGAAHGDVGCYLVGLWGFNSEIIEAVAFHNGLDHYPASGFTPALAVHVADYAYYKHFGTEVVGAAPSLALAHIESVGCAQYLESWLKVADEFYQEIGQD